MWHRQQGRSVKSSLPSSRPMLMFDRAKRYERLMKANGISLNGGPDASGKTAAAPKEKSKAAIAKAAAAKRRKIEGDQAGIKQDDDEDIKPVMPKDEMLDYSYVKPEPHPGFAPYMFPQITLAPPAPFCPQQIPHISQPMPQGLPNFMLSSQTLRASTPLSMTAIEDCNSVVFEDFCTPDLYTQPVFDQSMAPTSALALAPFHLSPPLSERPLFTIASHPTFPHEQEAGQVLTFPQEAPLPAEQPRWLPMLPQEVVAQPDIPPQESSDSRLDMGSADIIFIAD